MADPSYASALRATVPPCGAEALRRTATSAMAPAGAPTNPRRDPPRIGLVETLLPSAPPGGTGAGLDIRIYSIDDPFPHCYGRPLR